MKIINENNIYFKSKYSDVTFPNTNLACFILDCIKSRENEILLIDEDLNKINSYDILENVDKIAKGLNLLGLEKYDNVGVLLNNTIEYSYSVLGIQLGGGVPILVNPNYSIEEIKKTLSLVFPKFLFLNYSLYQKVKDNLLDLFPNCKAIIVINDKYNESLDHSKIENIKFPNKIIDFINLLNNDGVYSKDKLIVDSLTDICLILFSSGTSGFYKPVPLTHSNIISNIKMILSYEIGVFTENQNILSCLPLYHIFGICVSLFGKLCYGNGYLILMKKYNTEKFLKLIQNEKVSFAFIVPPIGLDLAKSSLVEKYDCSSLKFFITGGAPFPKDIAESIYKKFKIINTERNFILQGYGLTESSVVSVMSSFKKNKYDSCGFLIPNVIVKVIDDKTGKTLDENQIGELYFKSPSLMKGYLNNKLTSNETFDEEGYYKTGDIGYFDNDGELFIMDRKKELIKSYGYQVAPAELESILLGHPKIKDVCVVGVKSERAGEVPKAFIVIKPNEKLNEIEIHEWFNPKVSHYKYLKGGIVFTDIIPKSPSGKILRRLLK